WRDRRRRLEGHRIARDVAGLPRDRVASPRDRPHSPHVLSQRHSTPPDQCAWRGCPGDIGLTHLLREHTSNMHRRTFLSTSVAFGIAGLMDAGPLAAQDAAARFPKPAALSFRDEKSDLKITAIRAVRLEPLKPLPKYQPTPGFWN